MRSFRSISTVNSTHPLHCRALKPGKPHLLPPTNAAGEPSPMTTSTSGAPKPPSFKRSSPRKKSRLRSRRVAAGGGEAEAEAAVSPALTRALLPASVELDAVPPPVGRALPRDFFEVDALDLAPRLLGKLLRRDEVVLRITEVVLLQKSRVFHTNRDCTLLQYE